MGSGAIARVLATCPLAKSDSSNRQRIIVPLRGYSGLFWDFAQEGERVDGSAKPLTQRRNSEADAIRFAVS